MEHCDDAARFTSDGDEYLARPEIDVEVPGTGTPNNAAVFAQFVDRRNNTIAGSQVTPIRLQLDGQPHEITVELNTLAWVWSSASPLALQITDSSSVYFRESAQVR